jgi:DNA-binding IclR family transcriptional regulator
MTQLEILLLVAEAPRTASDVAHHLGLMRSHAEQELGRLVRSGLVAGDGETYVPGAVAQRSADVVADLLRLSRRYRLAIIHAIFSTDDVDPD